MFLQFIDFQIEKSFLLKMKRGADGEIFGYQVISVMMNTYFKSKTRAVRKNY